jgi:hypothetical protein
MDNNTLVAIVTSVCTAGSTAGVAITALVLSNKRIDRVEIAIDGLTNSVNSRLDLLTGALHDLDKRLSIIEDRVGR